MTTKPRLSFWQIWNMCFGFMGIQFGFRPEILIGAGSLAASPLPTRLAVQ